MLVLGRYENQVIRIGDDIKITVAAIRGDKVLIGIEAPKEVLVLREELYDASNREASKRDAIKLEESK